MLVPLTDRQVTLLKQLFEAKAVAERDVNLVLQTLSGDLEAWAGAQLNVQEKTLTFQEGALALQKPETA